MKRSAGYITVSVLVFSGIFTVILGGLVGFIFVQNKSQIIKDNRERAVQIAEAGLDYYKWFLAHYPNDLYNGQGSTSTPPYEVPYDDPETGVVGTFSLDIQGETFCGETNSVEIESTGWTSDRSDITRQVYGKYARPSVAEYSFVINSNVWAGSDRTITGPYHSNGGIRMDGTNESLVTSAVADWWCTSSFGCSPSQTVDGVFGNGPNFSLWQFPIPQVDFGGITTDLVALKALAQSDGYYRGPSGRYGYRVIFQDDGTFDLYTVRRTSRIWSYTSEEGWNRTRERITQTQFIGNIDPPDDCPVIFLEDHLWIEGDIDGKFTLASADLAGAPKDTTVYLLNDLEYETTDGSDGITVIAEEDVLLPLMSPENLEISGIFIAQNGRFGRNHYTTTGSYDVPNSLNSYVQQDTLTMRGTVVSNGRVGTKWTCGGTFCSGYETRNTSFDRDLSTSPPPLTPTFDDNFTFVEWREVE